MISLFEPDQPMPVVLEREYESSLRPTFTPEEMLDLARKAGVESEPMQPVCIGVARESSPGQTRQFYYAAFTAPAVGRFRTELARLLAERGGGSSGFDPDALRPILPVATTDLAFAPTSLDLGPEMQCMAPLSAER